MKLEKEMKELRLLIDKEFQKIFLDKKGYQEEVFKSMKYSIFSGGKRLRPILLLKTCEMIKQNYFDAIPFALAIEMIHTYSLIHDDLPAMDNDDYRRGKFTNHKLFGESIAILAGDGLLNLAYETVIKYILNNSKTVKDYNRYLLAFNEISKCSGVEGMIGGQVVDILSNQNIDKEILYFMYKSKTAALIQASIVSGGIIGGANDYQINLLKKYSLYVGLAYQIEDDILDSVEDKKINKVTYLSYNSVEESREKIKQLTDNAIECLDKIGCRQTSFLNNFAIYARNRNK